MAWWGASPGKTSPASTPSGRPSLDTLKASLGRAGYLKLFILGLAIGIAIGIPGGRAAERFRLADYVTIEQMILDRERPAAAAPLVAPRLRTPAEPTRM